MSELTEQIKVVVTAREAVRKWADAKKAALDKWEGENWVILANLDSTATKASEAETLLRDLTLKAYAETGNKAPALGVGIREVTKLDYDKKVAFGWAKHHEMALQLDKKAFEKIVKADTPDFVIITQEPQATIATKL